MSSYGNTIPRNFDVWSVEENFRIDENVQVLVCRKNVRRRDGERDALGVGRYALGVTLWALRVGRWALGATRWARRIGRYTLYAKVPEKKSAWTGLDRVDFEKISSKSQCSNRKIGVDWSRQS